MSGRTRPPNSALAQRKIGVFSTGIDNGTAAREQLATLKVTNVRSLALDSIDDLEADLRTVWQVFDLNSNACPQAHGLTELSAYKFSTENFPP
jgi:hypothetical protein